ncbi:hypothetical protein CAI21_18290 [Alkalilimnicola ehrlichii]|uniref:Uncharacterized protein n=1 Tax=Alkalilimnicola ehrlichii TaxID=351052 RepID=A0A3E0WSG7_9GAMM|nr:hypothetical protein [Alkalilimnicola ehrlichii]RFA25807.1 hypothetical protein CAI21_18290 [Alkalilimnicola ehrlichii]RFA35091.1 hypothetical protein CAL65_13350 [Alkalilimnicola ehrlichii]
MSGIKQRAQGATLGAVALSLLGAMLAPGFLLHLLDAFFSLHEDYVFSWVRDAGVSDVYLILHVLLLLALRAVFTLFFLWLAFWLFRSVDKTLVIFSLIGAVGVWAIAEGAYYYLYWQFTQPLAIGILSLLVVTCVALACFDERR